MPAATVRRLLYLALIMLYLLHDDFWLSNDASLLLGLPAGLTFHILICVAAAALMALLVRFAWPAYLDDEGEGV